MMSVVVVFLCDLCSRLVGLFVSIVGIVMG